MTNPFENQDGLFRVLVNADRQHSLWPDFLDVPAGWTVALDVSTRQACLDHIESEWTDMRPATRAGA